MVLTRERQGDRTDRARARLAWRCRRGMLELDLLLQGFVDGDGYDGLDDRGRAAFEELLAQQDQPLLELLMLQQPCEDPVIADVIHKIRRSV